LLGYSSVCIPHEKEETCAITLCQSWQCEITSQNSSSP